MSNKFDMSEKVVVITGGAGLLGTMHAEAIAENGGISVLFDSNYPKSIKMTKGDTNGILVLAVKRGNEITLEYSKSEIPLLFVFSKEMSIL